MTTVPATAIDLGSKARYIISVTPSARAAVEAAIVKSGGTVKNKYSHVFDGFTVELPKLVAGLLAKIPNVLTVEEDLPVTGLNIQNNESPTPSWGIDRIDQRVPVGSNGSVSAYGYRSAGAGATIYIGDTGIYPHSDFGSRLSTSGYTSIADGNGTVDCNGHGTHVASTAAGTQYGVAKNANLVPVRILDCTGSGSYSGVIAGLDWILSPENPNPKTAAVLNLSIGGAKSVALNSAIQRLTNAGVVVVVAAGNENTDACNKSPASAPSAITVGATTISDQKASYSNFGSCVDINAPGSSITGAWFGSPTATNTISGTSMATPHVTGAVAVYLGLKPNASVLEATNYIDNDSTKDAVGGLPAGTPNKLLFVSPTDQGAPIVKPVVGMKSVSAITQGSATVNIDVNPGNAPTTLSFEYAIDSAFTTPIAVPVVPGSVDGAASTVASVSLTGLNPLTTYYFRIIGVNESGRTVSDVGSFTTLAPPVTAPISRVSAPTNVTAYSATLNGVVQAGNAPTKVAFVYGTSADFKTNTITTVGTPPDISGGTNFYNVTANVRFLDGGKTYFYKVVATNATGTTSSDVQSFVTPVAPGVAPVVVTNQSPFIAEVVTITGSINPQGQTTTVRLVMGKEASLTVSPVYINVTDSPFTGVDTVNVSAPSTTLAPGVRYYYAFEASNASGVTRSPVMSNVYVRAPEITSTSVSAITATTAQLNTVMNAGASNTRVSFIWGTDSTLASGTTESNGNPFAVTSAINTTVTASLTGLKAVPTYSVRTKIIAYTGPLSAPLLGPITSITTASVVAPT
jgi:hypothetical protein